MIERVSPWTMGDVHLHLDSRQGSLGQGCRGEIYRGPFGHLLGWHLYCNMDPC